MKFLVLALCVCAASAASFGQTGFGYKPYRQPNPALPAPAPYQVAEEAVKIAATPFVAAAKAVASVTAPVASPVAQAAFNTYQAAKQVEPLTKDAAAVVLRSVSEVEPNGFKYGYETDNGISAESTGVLKKVGEEDVLTVQGSYNYISADGTPVSLRYIADENGFQPQGEHLPVAPAVPEAILRSLVYIAAHYNPEYEKKF